MGSVPFSPKNRGQRIFGIVSGKGGVGKTTVSINLALAMQQLGQQAIAVDADINSSNMAVQLGFYDFPKGIKEALKEGLNALDVIYTHHTGLNFMPALLSLPSLYARPQLIGLRKLLEDIEAYVVVDSAPSFGDNTLSVMRSSDEIIVVTTPDTPSAMDALKAITLADRMGKKVTGIVVNRMSRNDELDIKTIEKFCGSAVIAAIPEDRHVRKCARMKKPLLSYRPYSSASLELRRLAALLINSPYRPSPLERLRGVLGKVI